MAARINQYESQIQTPSGRVDAGSGAVLTPQANIDLSGFAQGLDNLARQREAADINNARAQLAELEPRAQLDIRNAYNEIKRTWAPGQAPISEQVNGFISGYVSNVEKDIANPRARELVRAKANELRTSYMLQGADEQVGIETDVRIGQYGEGYKSIATLGAEDPTTFGVELAKLNSSVMEDDQIPLAQRQELVRKNSNDAAFAVSKVQAEVDPERSLATINGILGITEPTLRVASGDIVGDITRIESGNRLYADDGSILKGPAITTKDGRTIHAYGRFQMLEDTARDQARKLGIPWDRGVFLRGKTGDAALDAETAAYHDQLGQAYIADQGREFGGDPIAIAAAHNMGPEATRGWIAGRPYQTQSGKWWYPSGPKDMAAMPEETRAYLGKLGQVETVSPDVVVMDGEEAVPFRLLTPEQQLSVRSAAQSRLAEMRKNDNARFEVDRALFKQRITDIESTAKAGDPIDVPPMDEMVTFLGPAEAILRTRQLMGYQTMAAGLKQLPGLSNGELTAISEMPNPEGMEDRETRQFVRDTMAKEAAAILTLRTNDPGKAAADAPSVRTAYGEWQAAAAEFHSAGQNATPEQFDAVNAAQAKYVNTSFTQQRSWGVLEPKLPNDVLEGITKSFQVGLASGDARIATARMAVLPDQLGSYAAIKQVGDKAGDLGWFAMEGVPATVVNQLAQSRAVKPDEANKLLPSGIKPGDVLDAVNNAFAPLLTTFAAPGLDMAGDADTASRYQRGGVSLATSFLASGQASSAKDAASMAYQALYADRETVVNGVRVPNNFNADKVSRGLQNRIGNLPAADMYAPVPMPGLTVEQSQERIARTVRANGRWVTNETGDGAYLMVAGRPALNAAGEPISITFEAAQGEPEPASVTAQRERRDAMLWRR